MGNYVGGKLLQKWVKVIEKDSNETLDKIAEEIQALKTKLEPNSFYDELAKELMLNRNGEGVYWYEYEIIKFAVSFSDYAPKGFPDDPERYYMNNRTNKNVYKEIYNAYCEPIIEQARKAKEIIEKHGGHITSSEYDEIDNIVKTFTPSDPDGFDPDSLRYSYPYQSAFIVFLPEYRTLKLICLVKEALCKTNFIKDSNS